MNKLTAKINCLSLVLGMATSLCSGTVFLGDDFNAYSDAALAGQGSWTRAPITDNPSTHPTVVSGAVLFDWPPSGGVLSYANYTAASDAILSAGMVYASFDLMVTVAPSTDVSGLPSLRPGFFSFINSAGSAYRGRVAINPGSTSNTFTLGVSSGSQLQSNFSFSATDLALNTTFKVVVGYNIDTTAAQIWIDPVNQTALPVASAAGANTVQSIRRLALGIDNNDGASGFSNMGQFTLDNLVSATTLAEVGVAVPEPSTYAFLSGGLALGFILVRRRRS